MPHPRPPSWPLCSRPCLARAVLHLVRLHRVGRVPHHPLVARSALQDIAVRAVRLAAIPEEQRHLQVRAELLEHGPRLEIAELDTVNVRLDLVRRVAVVTLA